MFVPEVKAFCRKQNIRFKCLLLLDNAPGHSLFLVDHHSDIKVVFIATLKAIYYKQTFLSMDKVTNINAKQFMYMADGDKDLAVTGKGQIIRI